MILLMALLLIIAFLYFVRLYSNVEIDDVTPGIECDYSLIEKSDILWVIPLFENKSIADDRAWCDYIISLNKTLGMHGVYHTYREFGEVRDEDYVNSGINAFEKCFSFSPKMFKAPQMYLISELAKGYDEIAIMLDSDTYMQALDVQRKLSIIRNIPVDVISLPPDVKDPGELTLNQFRLLYY